MKEITYLGFGINRLTGLVIAIIFFLISFRAPGVLSIAIDYSVPTIIGFIQSYSLYVTLLLMMTMSLVIWMRAKFDARYFSKGIISFYIFHQILTITDYFREGTLVTLISELVFNTVCLYFFGFGIKYIYFQRTKIKDLPESIFWGISAFVMLNAILYFASIGNLMWKGRFFGLTSQPNFIGICSGLSAVVTLAVMRGQITIKKRLVLGISLLMSIYICLLSGSRSSMISCLVGLAVIAFLRIKGTVARFSFALIATSILALGLVFFDPTQLNYTDRGNTREETWAALMEIVLDFPVFGLGTRGIATTNSYLYSIAAAGIIGAFFFFKAVFHITSRLTKTSKALEENNILHSFFVGSLMFVLSGAMFEGFLLDSASIPVFVFWLLASLGK